MRKGTARGRRAERKTAARITNRTRVHEMKLAAQVATCPTPQTRQQKHNSRSALPSRQPKAQLGFEWDHQKRCPVPLYLPAYIRAFFSKTEEWSQKKGSGR